MFLSGANFNRIDTTRTAINVFSGFAGNSYGITYFPATTFIGYGDISAVCDEITIGENEITLPFRFQYQGPLLLHRKIHCRPNLTFTFVKIPDCEY